MGPVALEIAYDRILGTEGHCVVFGGKLWEEMTTRSLS